MRGYEHHDEKCENPYSHANPVADRFLVPARGAAAFDCSKDTTAEGFVITVSKEESDRRAKKEYEEFTRHLNHDSSVHAALSALRCSSCVVPASSPAQPLPSA
jgi:hypothetical protein